MPAIHFCQLRPTPSPAGVARVQIKEGHQVALVEAPADFERTLAALPVEVTLQGHVSGKQRFNVIVLFVTSAADLRRRFHALARRLTPEGGLWIAWPKKTSGVATDLSENVIRELGLAHGLVDNKVCAVTDVWSGLRFVIRLADRPTTRQPRRT